MKYFYNMIQQFMKKDVKILGRWKIDYCDKKVNTKIDLANEDHCGPCGEYILDKNKILSPKQTKSPKIILREMNIKV